jgi:hypothetical protein
MTTMNQARDAAYKRFIAEWPAGAFPTVPYCFDDETLDPPVGSDGRPSPWVRCSVRNLAGGQESLGVPGNRKYRRRALVRAEVFTAPGTGQKTADLIGQAALGMYEGRYLAGALTYDGRTAEVGLVDDGRWKLSTAETSFDYEEIK